MISATSLQRHLLSRRRFLATAGAAGTAALFARTGIRRASAASNATHHLVWVWQFSTDAEPNLVAARLRDHGLGILLKTHDGVEWMSNYDKSRFAVSGAAQLTVLANYFEQAGVPFHAWCVVKGVDVMKEARMAADVLAAGARSIFLDIEPSNSFWHGTAADAVAFGRELRRLQPKGRVVLSIDPRPWMLEKLPMKEFVAFSDEIAPQQYWRTFNTPANYVRFAEKGYPVPAEGVTPEFLVDLSKKLLSGYGLPISQVGQGATPESSEWKRFVDHAYSAGGQVVSSWRYGVTTDDVFSFLRNTPPRQPARANRTTASAAGGVHVVQAGDTLGGIAEAYGVTVDEIMAANGLGDANTLYVGQELTIPGAAVAVAQTAATSAGNENQARSAAGGTYTVEPGDSLSGIAGRLGTSVDALAKINDLTDPYMLQIGQVLTVPSA